jgi:hypothetical protein
MNAHNRTVYDHMNHARDEDLWIVIEHKRGYDGARVQIAIHDVGDVIDGQWVRWERGEPAVLLDHESVASELREASAIQHRSSPPFEPEATA